VVGEYNVSEEHTAFIFEVEDFYPVDWGSMFLWNVGIHLPDHTVPQSRRPQYKSAKKKKSCLINVY
jgi:hypothetical protein